MRKYIFTFLFAILSLVKLATPIQAIGHLITQYDSSATQGIRNEIDQAIGVKVAGKNSSELQFGTILSALLPYLYVAGGFILFIMMIWGGFEMLTGATEQKSQEAGKQRITTAVIGFILLFVSYWIAQILQIIFGIRIL